MSQVLQWTQLAGWMRNTGAPPRGRDFIDAGGAVERRGLAVAREVVADRDVGIGEDEVDRLVLVVREVGEIDRGGAVEGGRRRRGGRRSCAWTIDWSAEGRRGRRACGGGCRGGEWPPNRNVRPEVEAGEARRRGWCRSGTTAALCCGPSGARSAIVGIDGEVELVVLAAGGDGGADGVGGGDAGEDGVVDGLEGGDVHVAGGAADQGAAGEAELGDRLPGRRRSARGRRS